MQIGFARIVTDEATFAYLADVFVIAEARGGGLGQWLVETLLADPRLGGLRRWLLVTRDAASLYRRCGFTDLAPATYLEIWDPECYGVVEGEPLSDRAGRNGSSPRPSPRKRGEREANSAQLDL
jgi:GNAT superfamily N-acetyltransferase